MAKELPYFKFYLTDWLTGNVTLQDMATQGVFINICVLFWSRDCDLNYQDCIERFKKKDKKLVEKLIKLEIIKKENEKIRINFLEKQLEFNKNLSKTNKKNGQIGLNTQKKMAIANSENGNIDNSIGDEIKEDKIIFFKINGACFNLKLSEFFLKNNAYFFEQWKMKNGEDLGNKILEKMDLDYLGYDFTEENHVQNCFKYLHKNWNAKPTQLRNNSVMSSEAADISKQQEDALNAKYAAK